MKLNAVEISKKNLNTDSLWKKNHNSQQEQVIFCDCLTVCNKYQFPDSFYVPLLFLHEL